MVGLFFARGVSFPPIGLVRSLAAPSSPGRGSFFVLGAGADYFEVLEAGAVQRG